MKLICFYCILNDAILIDAKEYYAIVLNNIEILRNITRTHFKIDTLNIDTINIFNYIIHKHILLYVYYTYCIKNS